MEGSDQLDVVRSERHALAVVYGVNQRAMRPSV